MMERIQKIMARGGVLSRRKAEELITQGKVMVNGKKVTALGTKAHLHDVITVSGKRLVTSRKLQYLIFHKPRECVVTRNDPEGRKTVYDYLPEKFIHLKPVGRLDYHSEGLLLLTNDGTLAQKLTHPQHQMKKVYEVKVQPTPSLRQLERLRKGVMLDGRLAVAKKVEEARSNPKTTWLKIVLEEGRNRQIRRMCEKVGLEVKKLIRIELGSLKLKGIAYGHWKLMEDAPKI